MRAYKAFNNDWSCSGFKFEVGKTYKHRGKVKLCESGFHACMIPYDMIKYYDLIQYNKFAEVECSGDIDGPNSGCSKISCREITIVKELSFDEVIMLIKNWDYKGRPLDKDAASGVRGSSGVRNSYGVRDSYGVSDSYGVHDSYGVSDSYGVRGSSGVRNSLGVSYSYGVRNSSGARGSSGVSHSSGVRNSSGVHDSYGVSDSYGVRGSSGVRDSYGVSDSYGVRGSYGVSNSFGVLNSEGTTKSLFVVNRKMKPKLFKTLVTEDRFNLVMKEFKNTLKGWYPEPTNMKKLYQQNGNEWEATPIHNAVAISNKESWESMPKPAINYLRSLPEFDAEVFKQITEIEL